MPEERTTSSTGGQKGVKIERHDLIPQGPLQLLAQHFGRGAMKYDAHQWRKGYEWSKSYSSLVRHLSAWWSGLDFDVCSNEPDNCKHTDAEGRPFSTGLPDTCFNHLGSHHLVAVAWHSFVLLEFVDRFPEHDDRFKTATPGVSSEGWDRNESTILADPGPHPGLNDMGIDVAAWDAAESRLTLRQARDQFPVVEALVQEMEDIRLQHARHRLDIDVGTDEDAVFVHFLDENNHPYCNARVQDSPAGWMGTTSYGLVTCEECKQIRNNV